MDVASPRPLRRHETVILGLLAVAALFFFVVAPVAIAALGWRDILLVPLGRTVDGHIEWTAQRDPFLLRPGDFDVSVTYHVAGRLYRARDVVPPAAPPRTGEAVEVRYWPRDPAVARLQSQVSWTPLHAAVIVAFLAGAGLRDLVRRRRSRR